MNTKLALLLWSCAVIVGGFPGPDGQKPKAPAAAVSSPRRDDRDASELLPLRARRREVAADHRAIEDGTLGKDTLVTPPQKPPLELPVHRQRRMIKVFSLLHHDPKEQAKNVKEIKDRIIATVPKLDKKSEVDLREFKLLENGLWARCYWLRPLPPPLQDDDQCSVKELQYLIDKL